LEVAPLHGTLVSLLQADLMEQLAGLTEPMPACGQEAAEWTPAAQLLQRIETLSLRFATEGFAIYGRKTGAPVPVDEKALWLAICRQVHALTQLPGMEAEFSDSESPEPWSSEARSVLPSSSAPLHPSAIWGPVLAYVVIEGMAESVAGKDSAATALALFDRLRLREPLARAFSGGGDITEDGWRAAARVRLAFVVQTLTPAKPAKTDESFAGFPRSFWDEGDARWLLKVHEAAGEEYFNKELHQQMLWWTHLPDLLRLAAPDVAGKKTRQRPSIQAIEERLEDASEQAEEAGFRLGKKKEPVPKVAKREKGALAK
jgi:hypothetical protein